MQKFIIVVLLAFFSPILLEPFPFEVGLKHPLTKTEGEALAQLLEPFPFEVGLKQKMHFTNCKTFNNF